MKTKNEIFTDYKMDKIIESKKTVLKLDLLLCAVVAAGIITTTFLF